MEVLATFLGDSELTVWRMYKCILFSFISQKCWKSFKCDGLQAEEKGSTVSSLSLPK